MDQISGAGDWGQFQLGCYSHLNALYNIPDIGEADQSETVEVLLV